MAIGTEVLFLSPVTPPFFSFYLSIYLYIYICKFELTELLCQYYYFHRNAFLGQIS